MRSHQGSILVPMVIIMVIGAVGAAYVARYFSVTAHQAVGLRQSRLAAFEVDQRLAYISSLLNRAAHDLDPLPANIAAAVTEQQAHVVDGMKIMTSDVSISVTQPAPAMVRQHFVRFPLLRRQPPAPIISRNNLPAPVTLTVEMPPGQAGEWVATRPQDLMLWLLSAPEVVTDENKHIDTCAGLDHTARGVYVINSNCELAPLQIIGSAQAPVFLVIKNADLHMPPDSRLWGTVVSDADDNTSLRTIVMAPTAQIMGALLINHQITTGSALNIAYKPDVLATLQNAPYMQLHQDVAGTWRDFPL